MANESIGSQTQAINDGIHIGPGLLAYLHHSVCIHNLHANEGVVGNLDEFCILDTRSEEWSVVNSGIKILQHFRCSFILGSKQDKLRVVKVGICGSHSYEERIVT